MNGADAVLRAWVAAGGGPIFANPGTSEMHLVAALDRVPGARGILTLFEGVATGAADGYGRIAVRPAAALLHLGPGLGNGLANLHNARKAGTALVALVGDHALDHKRYDAQLESDIDTVARNVSCWQRRSTSAAAVATDVVDAVRAALGPPSGVATLIVPADVGWSEGGASPALDGPLRAAAAEVDADAVQAARRALTSGEPAAILVGGSALTAEGQRAAAGLAVATGARIFHETFPARQERGAGIPTLPRLPYFGEQAAEQLAGVRHLVLVGAKDPVSFFAYPGKPSRLAPDEAEVLELAPPHGDGTGALVALAAALDAGSDRDGTAAAEGPEVEVGEPIRSDAFARAVASVLPEGAIVSDEANTSGARLLYHTATAPPHTWLTLTGGAIGQGLPVAVGAAVAAPDRPVLALQADGSAMYTAQALWTMAREGLDVTVVIADNRRYAILDVELARVGAEAGGPKARDLFDIGRPPIDHVALARGLGVPATRAETGDQLQDQLTRALAEPGPHLVQAAFARR